jgi:hypothetical protein
MDSLLAAWDWGASSATLVHDLDLLSHSRLRLITGGKALAVAADASVLEREIAREIPPAGWVYEAVGRARFLRVADGGFLGTEIDTQFQNLNSAYQASGCEPLFSSVSLADLRGLSPSPLGNTGVVYKGSLYGYPCSGPKAYEPPLSLVFGCRDQSLDVLNGSTGVFQGAQFPIPGNELQISGNYAAWATLNTAPARGLTAPTWSVTVHVRTLLGAPVANTVVVPSQPEQTGMHGTIVNFLGGPTGFVIGTRNEATDAYTVTYLSPQGKIVDTQPVGPLGPNAISVLSSHTFLIAERPCSSPECQGTSREPAIYDSGDKDLLPAAAHRGDKWH